MFRNISLFIVLLAVGVWVLSIVKAPEAEPTPLEVPELALEEIELLEEEIESLLDEVLEEEQEEELEEEPAQLSLERDAEDPTLVLGKGFSLSVPEDWLVLSASERSARSTHGRYSHGSVKNLDAQEAYGHPTEVSVSIVDYEKADRWTLESVVDRWAMDEEKARSGVEVYLFDIARDREGLTEEEQLEMDAYMEAYVTVEVESVQIDGRDAYINTLICEQACYIEGYPPALIAYYIDAGDRVWVITGRTAYSDQADELLRQAQEIMDSFELN